MIYLAKISVEIKRALRKKDDKYNYTKVFQDIEMIYTEGSEKNEESFFIGTLKREIELREDKKEEYKIINIEKIKPLGLVLNE